MLRLASFSVLLGLSLCALLGCSDAAEPNLEPQDSFAVILSEALPVPVGKLSEQVVLAGRQFLLAVHLDTNGVRLEQHGPLELALPTGLRRCEGRPGSLDLHCLELDPADLHVLEVSSEGQTQVLSFRTVAEAEIVDVLLLQPDEEKLQPGTWVQVDAVGVTAAGLHVLGIHPEFKVGEDSYVGYFAYQFDPDAPAASLELRALDRRQRSQFRGVPDAATRAP